MDFPPEIARLMRRLEPFDSQNLIAGVGGLQLLPKNADLIQRLELAACISAVVEPNGRRTLRSRGWRRFLNSPPLSAPPYRDYEDPYNNIFVESFTFHGGPYNVLGENSYEPIFVAKRLADALIMNRDELEIKGYYQRALSIVTATLLVSDEIVRRCGLESPTISPDRFREHAIIPAQADLGYLAAAVTFTPSQLDELLDSAGLDRSSIAPLICPKGPELISRWAPIEGPLLPAPIVEVNEVLVVALPHALLSYLRHAICSLASSLGVEDQLARAYRMAVHNFIGRSLSYLNNVPISGSALSSKPDWCEEGLYRHDTDKITHVLVGSDSLADYDSGEPFGPWRGAQAIMDLMQARARDVDRDLLFGPSPPNEILHVLVLQGLGRSFSAGVGGPAPPLCLRHEPLSGADIEIICQLEGGNPLALWQFSRSASLVREHTQIQAWSRLDEFDLYYGNDHSYYMSDEGTPSFISVVPAGTKSVKAKAYSILDMHGVPHPDRSTLIDVALLHGDRQIPVYVPLRRTSRLELLVELPEVRIWITSEMQPANETRPLLFHVADMISYWLWQMGPSISGVLREFQSDQPFVEIRLRIIPGPGWTMEDECGQQDIPPVEAELDRPGILHVKLSDSLAQYFERGDNFGERIVMETILARLASSPRVTGPIDVSEIIDSHAPLGHKKKLHFTSSLLRPEIAVTPMPPERLIQSANQDWLLEEIGGHLAELPDVHAGDVSFEHRTEMLRSVVEFLFENLEKQVATLSPKGLLESLVLQNERLLYEHALFGLTLPTQIACFGDSTELMADLRERTQKHGLASGANRFLIEYVVAQPPNGHRPFSLSTYDRLLAIAGMIVNYGSISDLVHHGLARIEMSVLRSGRLGIRMRRLDDAMKTHRNEFILGEIDQGINSYPQGPAGVEGAERTHNKFDLIDKSWNDDFGYSLADVIEFTNRCYELALDTDLGVFIGARHEFESLINGGLTWEKPKLKSVIEMLSLIPRTDFINPPSPFTSTDIYPWRVNRNLSYLRRPILVRQEQGHKEQLVIAPRICTTAARYVFNLCWTGRFKGAGPATREAMGALSRMNADDFNDEVAARFSEQDRYIVKTRVTKIAGERMCRGVGEPIGDIDVLVADLQGNELLLLETKDITFTGNPAVLSYEVKKLFGEEAKESKATIDLHTERADWVQGKIKKTLSWLGVDESEQSAWKIRPMIVTSQELISPYIRNSPFEVLSFRQLRALFGLH